MFSASSASTSEVRRCTCALLICAACGGSPGTQGTGAQPPPASSTSNLVEAAAGLPPTRTGDDADSGDLDGGARQPPTDDATLADAAGGSQGTDAGTAVGNDSTVPPTSVTCPATSPLQVGDNDQNMMVDGMSRTYRVRVPPAYSGQKPVPLLIDLHGAYSDAVQQEQGSGWSSKADTEGFVVVYPDGVGNSWNVGNCCLTALSEMVDDVGFIRKLVALLETQLCIDPKRIYASGISNGGGLAHRLACEAADLIAASAPVSSDLVTDPCTPSRPITVIEMRGLADTLVPYDGGTVGSGSGAWVTIGAKASLEKWKGIDHCTGPSDTSSQMYCETYTQCASGVEVSLCSVPGADHFFYSTAMGFNTPDVVWDIFTRFTLP